VVFVHGAQRVERNVGEVGKWRGAERTRVVDEKTEATEVGRGVEQCMAMFRRRDVAGDRTDFGGGREFGGDGGQRIGAPGVDHELPTVGGEGTGNGGAKSARCSGNQCDRHGRLLVRLLRRTYADRRNNASSYLRYSR